MLFKCRRKAANVAGVTLLIVQNTALLLAIQHIHHTRPGSETPLNSVIIILGECIKAVASLVLLWLSSRGRLKTSLSDRSGWIITSIPALLYTVQNNLLFLALANLPLLVYQIVYQSKIVTTALFSMFMLGMRFSAYRWMLLAGVMVGVVLVSVDVSRLRAAKPGALNEQSHQNQVLGLLSVAVAAVTSGFAGVLTEKLLKNAKGSLWSRSLQISAYSTVLAGLGCLVVDRQLITAKGVLHGFDALVWCVVALHAIGGLLVATVMKYANNVVKTIATSVSIVLNQLCSWYVYQAPITQLKLLGTALVLIASYLYSLPDFALQLSPSYVYKVFQNGKWSSESASSQTGTLWTEEKEDDNMVPLVITTRGRSVTATTGRVDTEMSDVETSAGVVVVIVAP